MSGFVHLHVHSEFSLLDGLARLDDLCQYAQQCGMPALALTDHGQMYGIVKFGRAATQAGIKPIYGCEVYQAPRTDGPETGPSRQQGLSPDLAGQESDGLSEPAATGDESQPGRLLLPAARGQGTAGPARRGADLPERLHLGPSARRFWPTGTWPRRREAIGWFKELFGPENYFLELQRHQGVPELEQVNPQLVSLAKEFGLRCVATNDVHYVRKEDASAQELLLAIQSNTTITDPNRMQMGSDDYYLTTADEMAQLLPEYPEALENTLDIAEQCNVDLGFTGYHLPRFDVPEGCTARILSAQALRGGPAPALPGDHPRDPATPGYELGVIHEMGFDDYFLITADLVNWAKHRGQDAGGAGARLRRQQPGGLYAGHHRPGAPGPGADL